MEDLLAKLTDGSESPEFERYREGIGFMLVQQLLVVEDGKVALNMNGTPRGGAVEAGGV